MALVARAKGGSIAAPVAEGTYPAVCCGLVDIGEQYNETYKNTARKLVIIWELCGETIEINGETQPRTVSRSYTNSLHERSALRKVLVSWRGREFTADELEGFDLTKLIGAPCLIQIVHSETDKGTYANISSIMAMPKGMPKPVGQAIPIVFDIDEADVEDLDALPEWIAERVKTSPTWKNRQQIENAGKISNFLPDEYVEDLPF